MEWSGDGEEGDGCKNMEFGDTLDLGVLGEGSKSHSLGKLSRAFVESLLVAIYAYF